MKNTFCPATALHGSVALPFVIPRACDLFFRDDLFFLGTRIPYRNMNCHPDRSAAKWRDLRLTHPASNTNGSTTLPFVIPSEAEGSAVRRARPGNVFRPKRSVGICSTALSPSQLFDKSLVLRISADKLAPRGQLEICKVEARRHRASYQRKRCSILQARGKPAARFHHRLESLSGLRPSAQMHLRIVSFSVDYVYDQCTPRIEMPHLIGRDAMECGKVSSTQ